MIQVVVQDENGNDVSEAVDIPATILPSPEDDRYTCLRFVDPYGDTVFNRAQLAPLLKDVQLLLDNSVTNGKEREAIQRIEALIHFCGEEPHRYLKFIGD